MNKKRIFILFLIIFLLLVILSSFPNIGYTIGGYSPEEFELMTRESLTHGGIIRFGNIKYNSFFWWPFKTFFYNKFTSKTVILAFLVTIPYWMIISIILSYIINYLINLLIKFKKNKV